MGGAHQGPALLTQLNSKKHESQKSKLMVMPPKITMSLRSTGASFTLAPSVIHTTVTPQVRQSTNTSFPFILLGIELLRRQNLAFYDTVYSIQIQSSAILADVYFWVVNRKFPIFADPCVERTNINILHFSSGPHL